ncbi:hypothetical protein CDD80_3810 [Ophiocordyceps camponoti-rufipedis]|uniref:Uncharacterized protein n=1 Tax=Ophiocordyceps camponoti-rufipedis TaxID=2004952 RepID=A0A2C5Z2R6_9HYPO|nr:hypothetical protein CDD80_3810 [Ophiocordyceps camponoti-rufipedis]
MHIDTLNMADMALEMEDTSLIQIVCGFLLTSLVFLWTLLSTSIKLILHLPLKALDYLIDGIVQTTISALLLVLASVAIYYCWSRRESVKAYTIKSLKGALAWLEPPPPPATWINGRPPPEIRDRYYVPVKPARDDLCPRNAEECGKISTYATTLERELEQLYDDASATIRELRRNRGVADLEAARAIEKLTVANARIAELEAQQKQAQDRIVELEGLDTESQAKLAQFECKTAQLQMNWRDCRNKAARTAEKLEAQVKAEEEKLVESEKKRVEAEKQYRNERLQRKKMFETYCAHDKVRGDLMTNWRSNLQHQLRRKSRVMNTILKSTRPCQELSRELHEYKWRFGDIKPASRRARRTGGGAMARYQLLRSHLGSRMMMDEDGYYSETLGSSYQSDMLHAGRCFDDLDSQMADV